jgi:hypothetical protein
MVTAAVPNVSVPMLNVPVAAVVPLACVKLTFPPDARLIDPADSLPDVKTYVADDPTFRASVNAPVTA